MNDVRQRVGDIDEARGIRGKGNVWHSARFFSKNDYTIFRARGKEIA